MPAIVRTADDEFVEVPTTEDIAKAKRFWIGIGAIPLIALIASVITWGVTKGEQVSDIQRQHTLDSMAVGGFPELAAQVHSNTRTLNAMTANIDESLNLQRQILRAVSKKP